MLKIKTVFVLGAGASVPFGFPTGPSLTRQVVERLGERGSFFEILTNILKMDPQHVLNFRNALLYSGKNSIDAFLEHRQEYMEVGKAAIAALLIQYQPHRVLGYEETNWLRYLYSQLSTYFDDFWNNKLAIVTFNYDRVVEWFLLTCLQNSFGKPTMECLGVLRSIPIIHLHGRLGYLPWEHPTGRDFNSTIDEEGLRKSIDQIKIIHEDITDGRDSDFEKAEHLLEWAEKIYFMGFGFNSLNVERLGIAKISENKSIATAFGSSQNEVGSINKLTEGKVVFTHHDCINFCRQSVIWS